MKNYQEILRKCPLFYEIEDNDLEKMLSCLGARVIDFDKKYTILRDNVIKLKISEFRN